MRRIALAWLALALGTAVAAQAQGTGVVAGQVVEADSREPVATAAVRVIGTVIVAFADDDGHFELRAVPAGPQRLAVERIGYAPLRLDVDVPAGGRVEIEIQLEAQAVAVGELVDSE